MFTVTVRELERQWQAAEKVRQPMKIGTRET
jgi:hypothetical protein